MLNFQLKSNLNFCSQLSVLIYQNRHFPCFLAQRKPNVLDMHIIYKYNIKQILIIKMQAQPPQTDLSEYESYNLNINNQIFQNFEIVAQIGKGKYSYVFKCIDVHTDKFAVVKVLKPVKIEKIKREVKILRDLAGKCNVVELYGAAYDQCSNTTSLIYPFVQHTDIRDLPDQKLTLPRIRKYIFKILTSLSYAHSKGIFHRDIKNQNILYNPQTQQALVADWGLAEYHNPKKEYNVRVASRYYKGPQLLLNNKLYDYSLDIWSLGCVMAGLVFFQSVFFRGDDNADQMRVIAECVGTDEVNQYVRTYMLEPDEQVTELLSQSYFPKKPWTDYIDHYSKQTATELSIDLISKMLVVDHKKRITAAQALKHAFFNQQY